MKTSTRWSCWAAAALPSLGSLGSSLVGCAPAPRPPLRLALNRWIGFDALWLADHLGFIAAEGLRIEILETTSTGDSWRLVELRQVDVFGGTMMELLNSAVARTRRAELAALLPANRRAIERIRTDPAALQPIATRQGLPAAAVAEALRGLILPDLASQSAQVAEEGLLHRALTRAGETLFKFGPLLRLPAVADLFGLSVVRPTAFAK